MPNEAGWISVLSDEPITKKDIQVQLNTLDVVLPRCVEDLISVAGISEASLPQIMQDRLAQKRVLRQQIATL